MLDISQYGITTGDAPRAPTASALTGRPLDTGHVVIGIPGTPFTVAVNAKEFRALALQELEAMKAEWAGQLPQAPVVTPQTPAYEDATVDDLKAQAIERGVDLTGRKSKADIIQALRAADVAARFADVPASVSPVGED